MATLDTVKEVLESNLDIDPENLTEDATFDDLGIDSLDMVELICDLEEKCSVDFGEPEGLTTLVYVPRCAATLSFLQVKFPSSHASGLRRTPRQMTSKCR